MPGRCDTHGFPMEHESYFPNQQGIRTNFLFAGAPPYKSIYDVASFLRTFFHS